MFQMRSEHSGPPVHLLRDARVEPLPYLSYAPHRAAATPIVLDTGAWEWRAGWAGAASPALVFRSVVAKTRRDRTRESELLAGSDVANIEAVRHALRSPYDRDVVTHYEAAEHLLDHTFAHLGLDTEGEVQHPVLVTEAVAQPNSCRQLYNQLLFELYNVPAAGYGIDSLFSLGHNMAGVRDALVLSLGHQTLHILPVVGGQAVLNKARRVNIGGAQMSHYLQRSLQLKYPNHINNINLGRAEKIFTDHAKIVVDFFDQLKLWKDADYYDNNVVKIQLPFSVAAKPPPADPEILKAKRQELAKRLVELNAKKRDEKLIVDEAALKEMLIVKEYFDQGNHSKFTKSMTRLNFSPPDIHQLQLQIDKLSFKIQRAKEAKSKYDLGIQEVKMEPEIKKKREDMTEKEKQEYDNWIVSVRKKLEDIRERKQARLHRKQQMVKRRTAASQERMRIISQLAKNTKKEDTFGLNDDDWEVYKQISMDGGDSDSEEENLQSAEYEAVLREHDPRAEEEVGRDNPEWHQIHLGPEVMRTPQILFQPSLMGHDQAGLAELIQFVLAQFPADTAHTLANNVFLTGGLANLRGLQPRLEAELLAMRPFRSTFKVTRAADPSQDAWRGASSAAAADTHQQMFLSRQKYEECGEGYLEQHFYSNKYFPTPSPTEKLEFTSAPATPSVKDELSYPSTPIPSIDNSAPPSPFPLAV